jgi:isopentenyl-diphosphate delta-isomerase
MAPTNIDHVVLVDSLDREMGTMEKMEAHERGLLHRAFSIFIFNRDNELLIHQRAFGKYHSEGLWTNTCCSHPFPGESTLDAAHRRLQEEMGMTATLEKAFDFTYQAVLDKGLIEHELDHVYIGFSDNAPNINTEEVHDYRWVNLSDLNEEINAHPERFTAWFRIIMDEHFDRFLQTVAHEGLQKRNI